MYSTSVDKLEKCLYHSGVGTSSQQFLHLTQGPSETASEGWELGWAESGLVPFTMQN